MLKKEISPKMSSSLLGVRRISQRGCVFLLPVCQFSFVPGCRISLCSTLLHSSSHLCFSAAMSSLLSSISGSPPANACLACCNSRTWEKVSPLKKCLHFENLVHAADHPVVEDLDVLTLIIRGVRVRVRGLVSLPVHWDHLPKKDKAWNTWFT